MMFNHNPFVPGTGHNPALPDLRRALVRTALRDRTALALTVAYPLAWQAEQDAAALVRQHGHRGARRLAAPSVESRKEMP
jgi:hypothetical protein